MSSKDSSLKRDQSKLHLTLSSTIKDQPLEQNRHANGKINPM
jgi:hypothetical protein